MRRLLCHPLQRYAAGPSPTSCRYPTALHMMESKKVLSARTFPYRHDAQRFIQIVRRTKAGAPRPVDRVQAQTRTQTQTQMPKPTLGQTAPSSRSTGSEYLGCRFGSGSGSGDFVPDPVDVAEEEAAADVVKAAEAVTCWPLFPSAEELLRERETLFKDKNSGRDKYSLSASPPSSAPSSELEAASSLPFADECFRNPWGWPRLKVTPKLASLFRHCDFLLSAGEEHQFPIYRSSDAEVVFAGSSNAGKSTLINALVFRVNDRDQVAKVSKTPGKTQTINFFVLGDQGRASSRLPNTAVSKATQRRARVALAPSKHEVRLVDFPGYGFAKAPGEIVDTWNKLIGRFVRGRAKLDTERIEHMAAMAAAARRSISTEGAAATATRTTNITTTRSTATGVVPTTLMVPPASLAALQVYSLESSSSAAAAGTDTHVDVRMRRAHAGHIAFAYAARVLRVVTVLVDGSRKALMPQDKDFIGFLADFHVPFLLVVTKTDMLSPMEVATMVNGIRTYIGKHPTLRPVCHPVVFAVSSKRNAGIAGLRRYIAEHMSKELGKKKHSTDTDADEDNARAEGAKIQQ